MRDTTVAGQLGIPRQKVNYHLRTLESHGLVVFVEERPRRGLTERSGWSTPGSWSARKIADGNE